MDEADRWSETPKDKTNFYSFITCIHHTWIVTAGMLCHQLTQDVGMHRWAELSFERSRCLGTKCGTSPGNLPEAIDWLSLLIINNNVIV